MANYKRSQRKSSLTRITVIAAIVVLLGLVLLQTSPQLRGMGQGLRSGFDDLVTRTSQPENNVIDRLKGMWTAQGRVSELEAEVRDLSRWKDTAIAMSERLERYEELLNISGEPQAAGASARVVIEVDGPFAESRLANAGRLQGVEDGSVALNTQGLVGRIIRVGDTSSRILLVTDFNSRVPVAGQISGVRAILAGGRGEYGRLIDKPEDDPFVNGELLLTTGEGGLFPAGLRVGSAIIESDEWVAELAINDGAIDFVRLLPPTRIHAPEEDPIIEEDPSETSSDEITSEDTQTTNTEGNNTAALEGDQAL